MSLAAQNVDEWRRTAAALRKAGTKGQGLRRQLRSEINDAAKPVLLETQEAVRSLRVTSETRSLSINQVAGPPARSHGGGRGQRRKHAVSRARTERAAKAVARRPHSLREAAARATKLQQTVKGVRFVVRGNLMPPGQESLPRHLDSEKGWRHPFFGNKEVWFTEKGGPWFGATIKKKAPEFRRAVLQAVDKVKRELG